MPLSFFTSFRSTVTPFLARPWTATLRLLVDPRTGAPAGIQNPNDVGPDGIWAPIDITTAQLNAPPARMLADLNAVYRLNAPPYTRYQSTGSAIVAVSEKNVVPATGIGSNIIVYAPWVITAVDRAIVQGTVHVYSVDAVANGINEISSVGTVAASGNSQGTATQLLAWKSIITSGTGGVIVRTSQPSEIVNRSGAAVDVYPNIGAQIENYGTNNPFSLPDGVTVSVDMVSAIKGYAG